MLRPRLFRSRPRLRILALIVTTMLLPGVTLNASVAPVEDTLPIAPKAITIHDGDEAELKIEPAIENYDAKNLKLQDNALIELVSAADPAKIKVKAKERGLTTEKAEATVTITYEVAGGNKTAALKVTVEPRAKEGSVLLCYSQDRIIGGSVEMIQSQRGTPVRICYVNKKTGGRAIEDRIQVTSDTPSVVTRASDNDSTLVTQNVHEGEATITVGISAPKEAVRDMGTFKVKVVGKVAQLMLKNAAGGIVSNDGTVNVPEGETASLDATLLDPGGQPLSDSLLLKVTPTSSDSGNANATVREDGTVVLSAFRPTQNNQPVRITFTARQGDTAAVTELGKVQVTVLEKHGFIEFAPPPRGFLLPNQPVVTTVTVRGRNGNPIPDSGVRFDYERPADKDWVTLSPEGKTVTIYWADPPDGTTGVRPQQVGIKVIAYPPGGESITQTFWVRMREIKGFAPLSVKLDVMDTRTATDLYGRRMSEEYHVLLVRLFNNLKDERTRQYSGDSILAYSSSIEVAVGMEKKFDGDNTDSYFKNIKKKADVANGTSSTAGNDRATAIASDQTELNNLIGKQRAAEIEVNRERANVSDKYRDATASIRAYRSTPAEPAAAKDKAKKDADAAIGAYREAKASLQGAEERLRYAERTVEAFQGRILRRASERVDVADTYERFEGADVAVDDGKWRPLSRADLDKLANQDYPEETLPFAGGSSGDLPDLSLDGPAVAGQQNGNGSNGNAPAGPGDVQPGDLDGRPACRSTVTYRPFTFEMMVNTVDRREGRSFRTGFFKVLDGVGTATSFVTAIAVPGAGSDLPLALEKYRNLFIPGAERLYPDYKEPQRQNIVSQAMKPFEEIPFGSDITRVIFIPKKNIRGVLRGHDVRISEVCPFYFKVDVAIVSKAGTVQQDTR